LATTPGPVELLVFGFLVRRIAGLHSVKGIAGPGLSFRAKGSLFRLKFGLCLFPRASDPAIFGTWGGRIGGVGRQGGPARFSTTGGDPRSQGRLGPGAHGPYKTIFSARGPKKLQRVFGARSAHRDLVRFRKNRDPFSRLGAKCAAGPWGLGKGNFPRAITNSMARCSPSGPGIYSPFPRALCFLFQDGWLGPIRLAWPACLFFPAGACGPALLR